MMESVTSALTELAPPGLDPLLPRCPWAGSGARPDPPMVHYHDEEWGTPVTDDRELFERLALESFPEIGRAHV